MLFKVIGNPQGKQRAKVTITNGRARGYTPQKTVAYEDYIKFNFLSAGGEIISRGKAVFVGVIAEYPIPKGFSRKKRLQAISGEISPLVKPDGDNIVKVVCDALNGVAYGDDNQVTQIIFKKIYSDEPKLIVTVATSE